MFNQNNQQSSASSSSLSSSSSSSNPVVEFSPSQPVEQTLLQDHFKCPILRERMRNPVIAADGFTYECKAITQWIATRGARTISPMTGERFAHLELQDNILVRQMISAYQYTKPQRQQRALTAKDIELACQLREEELRAMLEKQGRIIETMEQQRDAVVQQLEPQQRKIKELTQENERLRKMRNLPEDKMFLKLHSEIDILEKQLEKHQQGWAASIIQLYYHRYRLKQIKRDRWLHKEIESLLNKKQAMEKALVAEQAALGEKLADLAKRQQWMEIAKQGQLAEAAKQEHLLIIKNLEKPLEALENSKIAKHEKIIKRITRFTQTTETKEKCTAAIKDVLQSQQQAIFQFGIYANKREKDIFKFFEPKKLLSQSMQKNTIAFSSSSSSSDPSLVMPFGSFKKAKILSSTSQIKLQNRLVKACLKADVDLIKQLIEVDGADPKMPDQNEQQPLAAAIWGLSFGAIAYLEKKVKYTLSDYTEIALFLKRVYLRLLPLPESLISFSQFFEIYERHDAEFIFDYEAMQRRQVQLTSWTSENWREETLDPNLIIVEISRGVFRGKEVYYLKTAINDKRLRVKMNAWIYDKVNNTDFSLPGGSHYLGNRLCGLMVQYLSDKSVRIDRDDCIMSSQVLDSSEKAPHCKKANQKKYLYYPESSIIIDGEPIRSPQPDDNNKRKKQKRKEECEQQTLISTTNNTIITKDDLRPSRSSKPQ